LKEQPAKTNTLEKVGQQVHTKRTNPFAKNEGQPTKHRKLNYN